MAEDFEVPEDLHYTKEHMWVKVDDGEARVGITDYAQDRLGDVVFVEFPEVGDEVQQVVESNSDSPEIGAVESIKAVSEIYSPLSGKVKEVNEGLNDEPEIVNVDPYGDGWICVIEPSDLESEMEKLLDSEAYESFVESED